MVHRGTQAGVGIVEDVGSRKSWIYCVCVTVKMCLSLLTESVVARGIHIQVRLIRGGVNEWIS